MKENNGLILGNQIMMMVILQLMNFLPIKLQKD